MITQTLINELFEYKDGDLYWKYYFKKKFQKASNNRPDGYSRLTFNGKTYYTHRIIFLMQNGYLPKYIDHIDGNPSNNKITNLREATSQQNHFNSKIQSNNSSGIKGISWNKKSKKWQIHVKHYSGRFTALAENLELAELIAQEARLKYHGEFARN